MIKLNTSNRPTPDIALFPPLYFLFLSLWSKIEQSLPMSLLGQTRFITRAGIWMMDRAVKPGYFRGRGRGVQVKRRRGVAVLRLCPDKSALAAEDIINSYRFINSHDKKVPYMCLWSQSIIVMRLQSCLTPSFHGNDPCPTWPTYVEYEHKHPKTICWNHTP